MPGVIESVGSFPFVVSLSNHKSLANTGLRISIRTASYLIRAGSIAVLSEILVEPHMQPAVGRMPSGDPPHESFGADNFHTALRYRKLRGVVQLLCIALYEHESCAFKSGVRRLAAALESGSKLPHSKKVDAEQSIYRTVGYGETWRNRLTPNGSQPMAMHSRRIPHCIARDTS